MSTDLNAIHDDERKHLVKRVLELAGTNMRRKGWWGKDSLGKRRWSHKNHSECECAALHIYRAAQELFGAGFTEPDGLVAYEGALKTFASVIPPNEEVRDDFFQIASWNDVPSRHVATVKRAFDRAIAKVA